MKKGIKRGVISLIVALLLLVPFSFSVKAESVDLGYLYSFFWWGSNGYTTIESTDYYSVSSHNLSVPTSYDYFQIMGGGSSFSGFVCQTNGANPPSYTCMLRNDSGNAVSNWGLMVKDTGYTMTENAYNIYHNGGGNTNITILQGSYSVPTAYDNSKRIQLSKGDTYDIFFMTETSAPFALQPDIYEYPGTTYTMHISEQPVAVYGNYYMNHYVITSDADGDSYGTPVFNALNGYTGDIVPIYMGSRKNMTDDMYATLLGNPSTYGDSVSQESADNLDSSNSNLTAGLNSMSQQESQYNQDFNDQINQIDFTDQLSTQTGFLSSANFVITTFNSLIVNNPLTILIVIVCILYVARRFF